MEPSFQTFGEVINPLDLDFLPCSTARLYPATSLNATCDSGKLGFSNHDGAHVLCSTHILHFLHPACFLLSQKTCDILFFSKLTSNSISKSFLEPSKWVILSGLCSPPLSTPPSFSIPSVLPHFSPSSSLVWVIAGMASLLADPTSVIPHTAAFLNGKPFRASLPSI